jgi:hypothetical protein
LLGRQQVEWDQHGKTPILLRTRRVTTNCLSD